VPTDPSIATYLTESGKVVAIEIDPADGFTQASSDDTPGRIQQAIAPALEAAEAVLEQVRRMSPDQVQVKLGVKVTGTATWVVAKASTEGNFEITLTWHGQRENGAPKEMTA